MSLTVSEFVALGECPHVSVGVCETCHNDPSQLSYSQGDMSNLTHEIQVAVFGWCACEDSDTQYEDCPTHLTWVGGSEINSVQEVTT
jgi:hypothetical protein